MTTIAPSKPSLTSNDSAVLQALFDAESSPSPSSSHITTDASLPPLPHISPSILPALQARELEAIKPLNTPEHTKPEAAAIKSAITHLDAIIQEHEDYASAYVNRAQAYRLLIDSSTASLEQATSHCASLLNDLARAISLLTPAQPTAPVSPLTARVLANAHTHRAYLLYRASRAKSTSSDSTSISTSSPESERTVSVLPAHLREMSSDALEEMASYDFSLGGRYGNPVAKELAVRTNPYAKMCGAIVRDAMRGEIEEWLGRNR